MPTGAVLNRSGWSLGMVLSCSVGGVRVAKISVLDQTRGLPVYSHDGARVRAAVKRAEGVITTVKTKAAVQ